MVHKIKFLKLTVFFIIIALMAFFACHLNGNIETNLLRTFLPKSVVNNTDIVSVANKSSSIIKVVFETKNEINTAQLKDNFLQKLNKDYFYQSTPDISILLDKYTSSPSNFLSKRTRSLLQDKKYDIVYSEAINRLYNPAEIQIAAFDKDPYLLTDDFILSMKKQTDECFEFNGKYYDYTTVKIKNTDGLSPELSNNIIKDLIMLQTKLSANNSKIYLSGTPIHSFYTSKQSMTDINIICILSIIMAFALTYFYFRNIKPIIPIIISISVGMLSGYIATRLFFSDFQILTMVFSTTLIGIGIDYSYHYFFTEAINKNFIIKLTYSLLTSIIPFAILYLTGIELLEQIAVFTVFGLCTIYLIVLFIYPCFKNIPPTGEVNQSPVIYKLILAILLITGIIGYLRFHFNDSLTSLYSPNKVLKKAEALYDKVSGDNNIKTQFITVKGEKLHDIIEEEEKITDELYKNNIEYTALSTFIPSISRQESNYHLVKRLYNTDLDKYSDILNKKQITDLKNSKFSPVIFDLKEYDYLSDFMLKDNTSVILAYTDKKLELKSKNISIINIKTDIEKYLKDYRNTLLKILPLVILCLFIILSLFCGGRNAIKILIPSLTGIFCATGINCLITGEINLFCLIALFMVLGFTMDYSIFRLQKGNKTEDAIFISCITTAFSFLLLSMCGFKLLTTIAITLFFGIFTSYITGYIIFSNKGQNNISDENDKWFQIKEQSAGEKRLLLSWYLYKIFGEKVLYLIAFFVAFFTFAFSKEIRNYSKEYLYIVKGYTDIKPSLINEFKHIHSYAVSLVDRILGYSGGFDVNNITFENEDKKQQLFNDIDLKKGVFFICNHIGNVEVLQALLLNEQTKKDFKINVFLSKKQSRIFSNFIDKIKSDMPVNIFLVEEIGIDTGAKLKESLDNGNVVFIAGDRLAEENDKKYYEKEIFGKKIYLPKGTYKMAKLMDVPVYFISSVKNGKKYTIYLEKQTSMNEEDLTNNFVKFIEKLIIKNPLQFFHFYKFFN